MLLLSYVSLIICGGLLVWASVRWAMQPGPAARVPKLLLQSDARLGGARSGKHPLTPLLGAIATLLPPWRQEDAGGAQELYPGSMMTVKEFRGVRVFTAVSACIIALVVLHEMGQVSPLWVVVATALGAILPGLWLKARLANRKQAVLRLLPEVIDLLTLCVGAGLDFLNALQKVVQVRANQQREPLIQELRAVVQEINLGQRKVDALKAMARRVNVPELSSFVRTLVQGERMGTPLSEVLVMHGDDLRFVRYAVAERAALKAPIKILLPLIFCIMPCVALIVGGPIFLQFMKQSPFGR